MNSVSPMLEPSLFPSSSEPLIQSGRGGSGGGRADVHGIGEKKDSPKHSRRARLRSRVAANFNLHGDGAQGRSNEAGPPTDPPHAKDGAELESGREPQLSTIGLKQGSHSHSNRRPRVPHLNLADSSQQDHTNDTAGLHPNTNTTNNNLEAETHKNSASESHPPQAATEESAEARVLTTEHTREHAHRETSGSHDQQQVREVKNLLEGKKVNLSRSRLEELERAQSEVEARERKQLEKEQRRAAKLKADRKAAIEELKKRREEKRLLQEKLAQEEVVSVEPAKKNCPGPIKFCGHVTEFCEKH